MRIMLKITNLAFRTALVWPLCDDAVAILEQRGVFNLEREETVIERGEVLPTLVQAFDDAVEVTEQDPVLQRAIA
jgi:hypothetical protein